MIHLTDINGAHVELFAETGQANALLMLSQIYDEVFPLCLIKGKKDVVTGKSAGRHARPYQDIKDGVLAQQLENYRSQLLLMEEGQLCLDRSILRTWLEMPAVRASYLRLVNNPHWSDTFTLVQRLLGRPAEASDVALCFVPNVMPQDYIGAVFLDDVPSTSPAHLLVETSSNSWQAHFDLSEHVNFDEAHRIQRYLCGVHGGDIASTRPGQARRFPNPSLRVIHNNFLAPLDVVKILSQLPSEAPPPVLRTDWKLLPNPAELWERYYRSHNRNASTADFCLALRLHTADCPDDQILATLQQMLDAHPRDKGSQYIPSVLNAVKKARSHVMA